MHMANKEVQRLYEEYKQLDDQYRQLAEKLRPFMRTSANCNEHDKLLEIGRQLELKLQELQNSLGIRRIQPSTD